jgi:hypothetical protein
MSHTVLHVILHVGYRVELHYGHYQMSTRLPTTGVAAAERGFLGVYTLVSSFRSMVDICCDSANSCAERSATVNGYFQFVTFITPEELDCMFHQCRLGGRSRWYFS